MIDHLDGGLVDLAHRLGGQHRARFVACHDAAVAQQRDTVGVGRGEVEVVQYDEHGVACEVPAIVFGSGITTPLDATARSGVARTVFALRRGITSLRTRDEATVASVVIAACNEVDIKVPNPGYAVYGEIQRAVHKEISRKVRKSIGDVCQRVVSSRQDARAWAFAARRSLDRMAVIAAGDVSIVLSDILNVPRDQLGSVVPENERSRRLLSFVLSPSYLELRKKLGMGVR